MKFDNLLDEKNVYQEFHESDTALFCKSRLKKKSYTVNNSDLSIMLFASKLLIVTLFGFLILWHFLIPNIVQPHPDIVSDV